MPLPRNLWLPVRLVIVNLTITPTILNEDRRILVRHPRDYYAK
jgi:hypothetical protein